MEWISISIILVVGILLGIAFSFAIRLTQVRGSREIVDKLFREIEAHRRDEINVIIENLKASFGNLSIEALSRSTDEFLKLARERFETERGIGARELEAKKALIDQQLEKISLQMETISRLIKELEKDRVEKFGELAGQLKTAAEQTRALLQTTNTLKEALASTRARGQWGERMAEDILRVAGFIENVNYLKQKAIDGVGSRPDYTFLLPKGLRLNMDCKFPLDNYLRYLEAKTDSEKIKFRNDFLRDVRSRMREITNRNYLDPEGNTLDYVLLFIPNEQIYAFIHEQDSSILDEGMKNRVVLCSPITLFAVLAVIRQAVENFALERTSNEILSLFGAFKAQWQEFIRRLELLGKRIGEAQKEYEALITTRRRQLEKPLDRIEQLRTQRGLIAGGGGEEGDDIKGS